MKSTQPQIVIGLGTGRCGTQSLAHLLGEQLMAKVHHERVSNKIHWHGSETKIEEFFQWSKQWTSEHSETRLIGDVASYYLPYVDYILAEDPTVKFICLKRSCTDTVTSFMQVTPNKNHWMDHPGTDWSFHHWDPCFPKYDVSSKQEALSLYWHEYYDTAMELQCAYPNAFKIFPIESLNTQLGQQAILDFLAISRAQMQFSIGIKANTTHLKLAREGLKTSQAGWEGLVSKLRSLAVWKHE